MTRPRPFRPGIDTLCTHYRGWLADRRVGLVCHPASLTARGSSSAERLLEACGDRLVALFGPEHGCFGAAAAGESIATRRHPSMGLPVRSLYGRQRRPSASMLRDLDLLVFDLQDIAARPYTYVSTLRYVLEAAAAHGKAVVVADRPIPLPNAVDGPSLAPGFGSFVGAINAPMAYGMTPGETALWLVQDLGLSVDLKVARMQSYRGETERGANWPPWVPPSPGIASWESARCYLATVFCEAVPAVDCGRGTPLPFQVFGTAWMHSETVRKRLVSLCLPGVDFHPCAYVAGAGTLRGRLLQGLRMVVRQPVRFLPVRTAVALIGTLQDLYGAKRVWGAEGTRPEFFDKLFGTDSVRKSLDEGRALSAIVREWRSTQRAFSAQRARHLLYERGGCHR